MNHPLNNGTTTGTYTPLAMYTPRPGADAHLRIASLSTGNAPIKPVEVILPPPTTIAPKARRPEPVSVIAAAPDATGYLPKPGSVAHRMCVLLQQKPGVRYTAVDVARNFARKKDLVPNLLARSIEVGLLACQRDCAEVFYSAGPHIARVLADFSAIKPEEPAVATSKQIPAKPAKQKRAPEDHSTPYKPKTILADAPAPVPVPPATAATGRKPTEYANLDLLEICDDPLMGVRALPDLKYQAVFEKLRPGKCIKCAPADVGKVAGGLRKYFERNNITDKVKTTSCYETDGLGRVWWVAAKAKKAA